MRYFYFECKEALLIAIIEHGLTEIKDLFDPDHDKAIIQYMKTGLLRCTNKS